MNNINENKETYINTLSCCWCKDFEEYPSNPLTVKEVVSIINDPLDYNTRIYMNLSDFKCLPKNIISSIKPDTFISNYIILSNKTYDIDFFKKSTLPLLYHYDTLNVMHNDAYVGFYLKNKKDR